MRNLILTLFLISCLYEAGLGAELPTWVSDTKLSDRDFHYIVCSQDSVDPNEAKDIAESKCLASAAKLDGVTVTVKEKTIQSMTGADSSEVTEISPLTRNVKCEWTNRFIEKVGDGFRVWLRCRVRKTQSESPVANQISQVSEDQNKVLPKEKYKRAKLSITSVPQADRVIVSGQRGERVIEIKSKTLSIELREGDEEIVVKKHGFLDWIKALPQWKHGDVLTDFAVLRKE